MSDNRGDKPVRERYRYRQHLSVIQAQTELLLDDALSPIDRSGLQQIQRSCSELTALVEQDSHPDTADRPLPESAIPTTIDRVVIHTRSNYLSDVLMAHPGSYGGIDIACVTDDAALESAIDADSFDWFLTDAVWSDRTGLDVVADLGIETPPYALLSVYSDTRTPLELACSGLLSPTASGPAIDRAIQPYTDGDAALAGFVAEIPGDALAARLDATETAIGSPSELATHLAEADLDADLVCLDPAVYRALSPQVIRRLRTPAPGHGRAIVLVTPTDRDPYDRSWIPTLGGRRFLTAPPELNGFITQLLLQRPAQTELAI